jgi:hypothetical protein
MFGTTHPVVVSKRFAKSGTANLMSYGSHMQTHKHLSLYKKRQRETYF